MGTPSGILRKSVTRDEIDITPDIATVGERLDGVNPPFFALLNEIDVWAGYALEQDRIGLVVNDLLHTHRQAVQRRLIGAEEPGQRQNHDHRPDGIGDRTHAVGAIKSSQPAPLFDPYLEIQQQNKQADVNQVPADEGESVGGEPVKSGAVENGGQRIEANEQG